MASKTGGWQQPLSQSSCSASCRASCARNKSWTAGCMCLKADKNSRRDRDREIDVDMSRIYIYLKETISKNQPRSIHASSWAFTRHLHGRPSCTIDIVTNVSGCVPQVAKKNEAKSRLALSGCVLKPQTASH